MTINYGVRQAGGLTAASPGDTLHIPFATFNDSGDNEGIGGTLAVTDIKVFKNGNLTARATDSGIHLGDSGTAGDTGQYADRVGLHRFSLRIYNTADDTGFYDAGSQYHVAIDSITVDGKTVRFFPAVFEVGVLGVNISYVAGTRVQGTGDTGIADTWGPV